MNEPPSTDVIVSPARSSGWKWLVCGMLLLATMLNYMDRLTLNQTAPRVMSEFRLSNEGYGQIESAFAVAFALGALLGGWMVDRWNVWWIYPSAVLTWSAAGFATGYVRDYEELLACRFLLGLAEAVHWPCALRTTQRILAPAQRTLGNGILQSGAAVGAVLTPLIVLYLLERTGTWRSPFWVVGALGIGWVALWLIVVRRRDLALPPLNQSAGDPAAVPHGEGRLTALFRDRRFWVLIVVVVCINTTWHFFRAWMPLFLQQSHNYQERDVQLFTSAYYLSTDLGSLAAGFATLWLVRRSGSVHNSRVVVFLACALLTTLSLFVAQLDTGPVLLLFLLVIGFGALGLFPSFYSFSQELTVRHQGKLTGMLGCINWLAMALLQWLAGRSIDQTQSYSLGLAVAGIAPLFAVAALFLFWSRRSETPAEPQPQAPTAVKTQEAVS